MSGEVQLCNTSCVLLEAGTLIEFLTPIYQEVARFGSNGDCNCDSYQFGQFPISKLGKETATSGLSTYAYAPNETLLLDKWPVSQGLIDSKHKLECSLVQAQIPRSCHILSISSPISSKPHYSKTDPKFKVRELNHPKGAKARTSMLIINNMLHKKIGAIVVPDMAAIAVTNSVDNILAQVL
jgi:hypothetical protein